MIRIRDGILPVLAWMVAAGPALAAGPYYARGTFHAGAGAIWDAGGGNELFDDGLRRAPSCEEPVVTNRVAPEG